MRVLIVEDETVAVDNLIFLLRKIAPDIEVAGVTECVGQTVVWLSEGNEADLIFMDIHLSDGSAFRIFEQIKVTAPVVFTTAYDRYALDAFKVNSVDYLLKPVKPDELRRALDKFRQLGRAEILKYLSVINGLAPGRQAGNRLLVPVNDKLIPVAVAEIACIYSSNKSTELILNDGRHYGINKSLEQLMSSLDPADFIRANKQFIIARDSVRELTVWFDNRLRVSLPVDTPEPVYVSKNRVAEFKGWLIGKG